MMMPRQLMKISATKRSTSRPSKYNTKAKDKTSKGDTKLAPLSKYDKVEGIKKLPGNGGLIRDKWEEVYLFVCRSQVPPDWGESLGSHDALSMN